MLNPSHRRDRRLGVVSLLLGAVVLLTGCDGDTDDVDLPDDGQAQDGQQDDGTDGTDDGTNGDGTDDDGANGDGTDEGDGTNGDGTNGDGTNGDGTDDDGANGDGTDDDDRTDDDGTDDGVDPLDGDPTTEPREAAGEPGTLAVTDVRLGQHDGFDRVVFDLVGDGRAGWFVEYVDEARAQGSGALVEVDGDAVLRVAIRGVTLPPDLPDTIEVWDDDRLRAPSGGVVVEVVDDTIFEGYHTVFIGTTGEQPFVIERLEDPQRVVIDIFDG